MTLGFKEPILAYFPDGVVLMPMLEFVPELTFGVHITQKVVLLHSFWGVLKKLAHRMWAKHCAAKPTQLCNDNEWTPLKFYTKPRTLHSLHLISHSTQNIKMQLF